MIRQIPLNDVVTRMVMAHDRDNDGVISLEPRRIGPFTDVYSADERIYRNHSGSMASRVELLYDADADGDRRVTPDELKRSVAAFDADGDGKVETYAPGPIEWFRNLITGNRPSTEQDAMNARYRERVHGGYSSFETHVREVLIRRQLDD